MEVSKPKATTTPMLQEDDSAGCSEDKQSMSEVRGEIGEAGEQGRPVSQGILGGQPFSYIQFQDPVTLLEIWRDAKEFLFVWGISIYIYCVIN